MLSFWSDAHGLVETYHVSMLSCSEDMHAHLVIDPALLFIFQYIISFIDLLELVFVTTLRAPRKFAGSSNNVVKQGC